MMRFEDKALVFATALSNVDKKPEERDVLQGVKLKEKCRSDFKRRKIVRKNLKEARQKAGMTQQKMADKLGINLRHYQKIEYGEIGGSFEIWNALEDFLGIHQRKLREISSNCHDLEENP